MDLISDLSKLKGMILAHQNICSLRNKVDAVKVMLMRSNLSVLGLSETNLNEHCDDSQYQIEGYSFLRMDRADHTIRVSGGGVGVYIREDIIYETVEDLTISDRDLETLGVRLKLVNTRPVYIINV